MTLILRIDPSKPSKKKMWLAANAIRKGGVVVFPTETVYGIGANALDEKAVGKVYDIKKRPRGNPMIIHVSSMDMANQIAVIPQKYQKILERLWPGPLTVIAKVRASFPKAAISGLDTICIRMPSNRIALMLIKESKVPIAAPSANISQKPSSTRGAHAKSYFDGKVDIIIDGGSSRFGLESTILDLRKLVIVRPGILTAEKLSKSFGKRIKQASMRKDSSKPISPGTKYRHYTPDMPMFMFAGSIKSLPKITFGMKDFAFIGSTEACRAMKRTATVIDLGPRRDPARIASKLFDGIIRLDSTNARFAIAESYDDKGIGAAIMNRLRKACNSRYFSNRRQLDSLTSRI